MLKHFLQIGHGVKRRDTDYFTHASGNADHSRFREDMRAIVGGALAAAFLVAAFSSYIPNSVISDGQATVAAAFVGGFVGKFLLA